jgi:hypothetical protein
MDREDRRRSLREWREEFEEVEAFEGPSVIRLLAPEARWLAAAPETDKALLMVALDRRERNAA